MLAGWRGKGQPRTMAIKTYGLRAFAGILLLLSTGAAPAFANPSILFELDSGRVLSHEDAFRRWHPASLTKLMTAYVTFRAIAAGELALESPIEVTKHSAGEPPSKMGFKPGSVMTLDNALKMMLIKSANDIAMAVGENVGGSERDFVARMNGEAVRLGMTDTRFSNPNGLHSPDQYTTARDLGLLVTALRTEFPQYNHYFAIQGLTAGKKTLMSYNNLVGRFDGADGMKTGFVCASGFNMIASATRGDRTLVAVVLGQSSALGRADLAAELLERGFVATGTASTTLASLPAYGIPGAAPIDMREEICNPKKSAAAKSEAAADHEEGADNSRWKAKLVNPKLAAVGLGGATGPVPKAWESRVQYADVPVPTPRPDYTPATAAASSEQGDAGAVR